MKARTWLRRAVAMLRRHGMPWLAAIAALHAAAATATTTTTAIDCPPQPRLPAPAELDALAASAPDRGLLWRLQRDGRVFLAPAEVDGRTCLRACLVNFRTTAEDIDSVPAIVAEVGGRVTG